MPIFTEEILNQGKSRNGFWSKKQLLSLGLKEVKKGWKHAVIGKELEDDVIKNFLDLKDEHLSKKSTSRTYNIEETTEKLKQNHVILTEEILNQGKSRNGFWSNKQILTFGIEIKRGWKREIIGQEFPIVIINRFLQLKDKHLESDEVTVREISYDKMSVVNLDIDIKEQYKNKNWIDLRRKILERDSFTCVVCKRKHAELHVHHMSYPKGKFIWEIDQKHLVVVCKECHEKIHDKELSDNS